MIRGMALFLREFRSGDEQELVAILNDEDVVRYLSSKIPYPYTFEDASWWINQGSRSGTVRAIEVNGKLVGCIGVNPGEFEYHRSGEIGYWLAKNHWRQGISKQAIKQISELVFSTTDLERIFGVVFSDNIASQKLLLSCGFEQEAVLKRAIYKAPHFYDSHIFSLLKP